LLALPSFSAEVKGLSGSMFSADRSTMTNSISRCLGAFLFSFLLIASSAAAEPAEYAGSSASGDKVFFTTAGKLVPGDTDNGFVDVYERFFDPAPEIDTYVTREISTGPTGGNDSYDVTFDGVSSDGTRVFFSTAESLVAEDLDRARDVYARNTTTGATDLISDGPASCAPCGNREVHATFLGATPSGAKAFISTTESLSAGDGDEAGDVYVVEPGGSAPVLATPGGTGPVTFQGASADGTKVVFETADKVTGDDLDSELDLYERDLSGGTTKRVSVGNCPGPLTSDQCAAIYRATAADGSVFLQTKAQMTLGDGDTFQDVYEWSAAGGPVLLSTSNEGEGGSGTFNAVFAGRTASGDVFFETEESLVAADGDEANDVYRRAGGATTLVSTGGADVDAVFNAASADGSAVFFSTKEPLGGGDSGDKLDVYRRSGVTLTLVSPGSTEYDAAFAGNSADGSAAFYTTVQKVSASDLDDKADVYEWTGGAPILVSDGPAGGNGPFVAHLSAVSEDGSIVFFATRERLTVDDNFAGENDVYEFSAAGTLLVSVGNSAEVQLGPPPPGLTATSPSSPGISLEPRVIGDAEGGTAIKIYPTADCSGAPAGTGTAGELAVGGIKVIVKAGSTTTFHATATNSSGDTSSCSGTAVTYAQQSVSPPPEEPSGGSGGTGDTGGGDPAAAGGGSTSGSGGAGTGTATGPGGIVYVAPAARITFGPAAKTRSRRPVFQFVDATGQPNTTFFCRIDHQAWKRCGSPYRAKRLGFGKHTFALKARSGGGQWQQRPVSRRFKVVVP
jgi:hypothetical protein